MFNCSVIDSLVIRHLLITEHYHTIVKAVTDFVSEVGNLIMNALHLPV
jgi:hypothetical protein